MVLLKCSECGKEISSSVKACPNCGKKRKSIGQNIVSLGFGIFILFVLYQCMGLDQKTSSQRVIEKTNLSTVSLMLQNYQRKTIGKTDYQVSQLWDEWEKEYLHKYYQGQATVVNVGTYGQIDLLMGTYGESGENAPVRINLKLNDTLRQDMLKKLHKEQKITFTAKLVGCSHEPPLDMDMEDGIVE